MTVNTVTSVINLNTNWRKQIAKNEGGIRQTSCTAHDMRPGHSFGEDAVSLLSSLNLAN